MSRSSGFWNFMAKRYTAMPIDDEDTYQRKLAITRALFTPDMRLLEIGCGSANTAITHAPHVAHIDAIDYSANMVAIAQENVRKAGVSNVNVRQSTPQDWQPETAEYDMVLALSVLHLLPDVDGVLRKLRSLTKTGGYFVSSTVLFKEQSGIARALVPIGGAIRLLPYLAPLDEPMLLSSLKAAGFEVESNWRPRERGTIFLVARAV